MGDKTPATTTQNQNSTSTASPYAPAVGLIDNLISKYSGTSTDPTKAQTGAAQNLVDAAGVGIEPAPHQPGPVPRTRPIIATYLLEQFVNLRVLCHLQYRL